MWRSTPCVALASLTRVCVHVPLALLVCVCVCARAHQTDVHIACLTIGAPGILETIFHTTECKSAERTKAVEEAFPNLPDEIKDLKRQLKNKLKSAASDAEPEL